MHALNNWLKYVNYNGTNTKGITMMGIKTYGYNS